MGFAPDTEDRYPIVNCDLSDIQGMPGLPPPATVARDLSTPNRSWRSFGGPTTLFLTTTTPAPAVGAFAPLEPAMATGGPADRVQRTFRSPSCEQATHQQLLRGRPVIGGRYRVVTSSAASTVLGGPVGDLDQRDPGRVPKRADDDVAAAVRGHLEVGRSTDVELERVVFPMEGHGVWAYRARVTGATPPTDVRAYLRADDLSLLYAQDVSCSACFGEGRVFRVNPGRNAAAEVVRMAVLEGPPGGLATAAIKAMPAAGRPFVNIRRDFRLEPDARGFDEVSAFHHMGTAMQFFGDVLGPDVFTDRPFVPLEIRVLDRTVRSQVGVFFPGRNAIALADGPFPAARSGDICVHEFTHAVVHRVARLDDEFASAIARGLNEGFADYAQATVYDDPRFGDWVRQDPQGARRCDDRALRLPDAPVDPTDRYVVGAAWAALLWDLRSSLGPGVADALAFHSLQFLVPGCDYDDAREALHHADLALFPARRKGRHRAEIDRIVSARMA